VAKKCRALFEWYLTVNRTIRTAVTEFSGSGDMIASSIDSGRAPTLRRVLQVDGARVVLHAVEPEGEHARGIRLGPANRSVWTKSQNVFVSSWGQSYKTYCTYLRRSKKNWTILGSVLISI